MKHLLSVFTVIIIILCGSAPVFAADAPKPYTPEIPPFLTDSGGSWDIAEGVPMQGITDEISIWMERCLSGSHLILIEQWSDNGYFHGINYGDDRKWYIDYILLKDKSSANYGMGSFSYDGGKTGGDIYMAPMRFIPSDDYEQIQFMYDFEKKRLVCSPQIIKSTYSIPFSYVAGSSPLSNPCDYYPNWNTLNGKMVFSTHSDVTGIDRHYNWWLGINKDISELPPGSITKPDGTIETPNGTEIKPDGTVTIPNGDGGHTTINPPDNGSKPSIDKDETVNIPDYSDVTTPGGEHITLPDGGTAKPDGTITVPDGGHVTFPGGTNVTLPGGGTVNPDGSVTAPNGGTVTYPDGSHVTIPPGSIVKPDGSIHYPGGAVQRPDGTITHPNGNGGTTTVKPGTGGQHPTVNGDGTITAPPDSTVTQPGGNDVHLPGGGIVHPNGSITVPPGGSVDIGGDRTDMPNGGGVSPDGTVTVKPKPDDGGGSSSGSGGTGSGGGAGDWNDFFPPRNDEEPSYDDWHLFDPYDHDNYNPPSESEYDPMDGYEDGSWLKPPNFPNQPNVPIEVPDYGLDDNVSWHNPFNNVPWW